MSRYDYERYILPDHILTMADYHAYAPAAGEHEDRMKEYSHEQRLEIIRAAQELRKSLEGQRRMEEDKTPSIPKVMSQVRGGCVRGRTGTRIF